MPNNTSTRLITYMDYTSLGNILGDIIAEAFETTRAEWAELRDQGRAPGPLAAYVEAHGPRALPAGTADTLSRIPAYVHARAGTLARDLIVEASRDRARVLPAEQRYTLVLSPKEARRYVHLIAGAPGPGGQSQRRKLSPAEVRFIRREHRPGYGSPTSTYALARLFGVGVGVIHRVVQGQTYRDVPDED